MPNRFKKNELNILENKIPINKLDIRLAHYEDIVAGLNDFCIRSKTNLLVMSHEKSFLCENIFNPITSITRKMTFHLHLPLLSIPDYFYPEHSKFSQLFDIEENYKRDDV